MKLRILSGRSGSGKSTRALEEIRAYLKQENRGRALLIVPEQFMINAERRLLEGGECPGLIKDEVLGFKRLAYMVFKELGVGNKQPTDSVVNMLVMIKTMRNVRENLTYYRDIWDNTDFLVGMMKQINEFERYLITPEILEKIAKDSDTTKKVGLCDKLSDIALIYRKYKENLNEKYSNSSDDSELLVKCLQNNDIFKGARIWIDEFHGFTGQENKIIEELIKQAERVTICLSNCNKQRGTNPVFKNAKKTYSKLKKICSNAGADFEKIELNENLRHADNPQLKHLEENYFKYPTICFEEELGENSCKNSEKKTGEDACEDLGENFEKAPDSINIFEENSPFDEVTDCAKQIAEKVKNSDGKITYKNISVMVTDSEKYEKTVETVFSQYNIPIFTDTKKEPSSHIYAKFIMLLLEAVSGKWKLETVFDILKTGFYREKSDIIDYLELYYKKTGVAGKEAFKKKVSAKIYNSMTQNNGGKDYAAVEALRKEICKYLDKFEEKAKETVTFGDMCEKISEFLDEFKITFKLQKKKDEILLTEGVERSEEFVREYEAINEIIVKMHDILKDEILPENLQEKCELFKNNFNAAISQCKVGYIPVNDNCIQIGTKERSRSHEIDYLYVLGANDGLIPQEIGGYGIISDSERVYLESKDVETAGDDEHMAISEQFNIYSMLTLPKRELNIFYSLSSIDGKKSEASSVVSRIEKLFPKIIVRKACDIEGKGDYIELDENPQFENFEPRNINFTKDEMATSFSKIESYGDCPYKFFLENVVGIMEEDDFVITPGKYGSIMHSVLENAMKKVLSLGAPQMSDISEAQCAECVEGVADEICEKEFGKISPDTELSAKIKYIIMRLKRSATNALKASIKYGKPVDLELYFGNDKNPPLKKEVEIVAGDGVKKISVNLKGRIDRVDRETQMEREKFSIIDYKTRSEAAKNQAHIAQLSIYMKKYIEGLKAENPNISEEEVRGRIINVYYDSNSDKIIDEYDFDQSSIDKYSEKIKDVTQNIYDCNYEAAATDACDLCSYNNICRKNRKGHD